MTGMGVKMEPAHYYWRNTNTFQWTYAREGKAYKKKVRDDYLWSNEMP